MTRAINAEAQPEPEDSSREIPVRIFTPEDFVGSVQGELHGHDGVITGMDNQGKTILISAVLPAKHFDEFMKAVAAVTCGRATVERP